MEIIPSKETKVLKFNFSKAPQSIEFSRKVYSGTNRLVTAPDNNINILNIRNRNNIIIIMDRYLEKKIFPTDCGEANTCFHVLFLYSIWGIRLQIRITNIGNKNAAKACHPCVKCNSHGLTWNLSEFFGSTTYIRKKMRGITADPIKLNQNEALRFVLINSALVDIIKLICCQM